MHNETNWKRAILHALAGLVLLALILWAGASDFAMATASNF
jgi:hypothetical protein